MRLERVGRIRGDGDGCRRYMAHAISFDTRAHLLTTVIEETWAPEIQEQWKRNQQAVREGIIHEFGNDNHVQKITDFASLDAAPWSVVALHNEFLSQIRKAFVAGAYYPALVACGALGERLLNQLVVGLRDDYAEHPGTGPVAEARSFTNWNLCIKTLVEWRSLTDETADDLRTLRRLRNRAVHYGEHLDNSDAREDALKAVLIIQRIIGRLFAPIGGPPIFIAGTSGHSYIARSAEDIPLVKRFYIPACVLVSPNFEMRPTGDSWFEVFDDDTYQQKYSELSDEEFAAHVSRPRP